MYGKQNTLYGDEEEEDTRTSLESSHEAENEFDQEKIQG